MRRFKGEGADEEVDKSEETDEEVDGEETETVEGEEGADVEETTDIELDKKEVAEIAEEAVAKFFEARDKSRRTKRFNTQGGAAAEAALESKGKAAMFMKALASNDTAALQRMSAEFEKTRKIDMKTLNEGTGSAGGYLVPVEFEKSIVKFNTQYNAIRQNSTVLPMSSKTKNLNELITEPVIYIENELVGITSSDLAFGEPILTAEKYVAISPLSTELEEDSELDVMNLIAERIGREIGRKEQARFITSTVSGSEGILTKSGVTTQTQITGTSFTNISWDDLANMQAALNEVDEVESQDGKFYMSMSVYNVLRKLKTAGSGEYFYLPAAPTQQDPAMAWGRPIVLVNQMPKVSAQASATKYVAYGDLSKHHFVGDRRGITVKLLTEATVGSVNLATQDGLAIRVTKRTAHVVALASGIVTLATG